MPPISRKHVFHWYANASAALATNRFVELLTIPGCLQISVLVGFRGRPRGPWPRDMCSSQLPGLLSHTHDTVTPHFGMHGSTTHTPVQWYMGSCIAGCTQSCALRFFQGPRSPGEGCCSAQLVCGCFVPTWIFALPSGATPQLLRAARDLLRWFRRAETNTRTTITLEHEETDQL